MRKLTDLIGASGLWNFFQWICPPGAAMLMSWWTYAAKFPPQAVVIAGLMTLAACVVITTALREQSVFGRMVLQDLANKACVFNVPSQAAAVTLRAVFCNTHHYGHVFFTAEVLSIFIAGRTNPNIRLVGREPIGIPPNGWREFVLPEIGNIPVGEHEGRVHLRIRYGGAHQKLDYPIELRILFRYLVTFNPANDAMRAEVLNFLVEDNEPR